MTAMEKLERDLWEAETAVNTLRVEVERFRVERLQPKPSAVQVKETLDALELMVSNLGLEARVIPGDGPEPSCWTGLECRFNAETTEIEFVEVAPDGDPDGATLVKAFLFGTTFTDVKFWLGSYETEQLLESIY